MTMYPIQSQADPRGSAWRRWDPYIHTPGTAMNNQFGKDSWDNYLTRIEQSEPRIEALGITDYCSIDEYEKVRDFQVAGRLPDVGVIFPNIELRLPTATKSDHSVLDSCAPVGAITIHMCAPAGSPLAQIDGYERAVRLMSDGSTAVAIGDRRSVLAGPPG